MPTIRSQRLLDPFTQIPNAILDNPEMTPTAKWVLCYLLSKPEDWRVREKDLLNHSKIGQAAIRNALKELQEHGYMWREQTRHENGVWKQAQYVVYDTPIQKTDVQTTGARTMD